MAAAQFSAADVLPREDRFIERLRSLLVEGRELSADILDARTIPLYVSLSSSTPAGERTFLVPNGFTLRLKGYRPHIRPANINSDTIVGGAGVWAPGSAYTILKSGDLQDRLLAYAMNCRIGFKSTFNELDYFDGGVMPLSNVGTFMGEGAKTFVGPNIIRGGTLLRLKASLKDSTAAISAAEYGIVLVGALVPENLR